ncbi:F-box protein [Aspergillus mulundensis]|uniref:F-box domain-containing protein n=1 Tax=Aspergillus mulundensis TaxID=1810919 RepID=A0A3D8T2J1_9EURO|nr:hypothetical protein DSM5745_00086 [Aspergillus mulundensis]RDW92764.1 hypothetical protein DSM5745_00086 [Aspergillus mulundensis]
MTFAVSKRRPKIQFRSQKGQKPRNCKAVSNQAESYTMQSAGSGEMPSASSVTATSGRSDPLRRFNFDINIQILSHLSLYDLGRCQQVNPAWRDFIRDWIAWRGLEKHFPGERQRVTGTDGECLVDTLLKTFNECAIDRALKRSWTNGRAARYSEYQDYTHFYANERYLAWYHDGSIFWQRTGYLDDGDKSPCPIHFIPEECTADDIEYLAVSPSGVLVMVERCKGDKYREEVTDLESGWTLWSKTHEFRTLHFKPTQLPVAIGWERLYRYSSSTLRKVEVYNLRTGAYRATIRLPSSLVPARPGLDKMEMQVCTIRGQERLVCWGEKSRDAQGKNYRVYFFDSLTGEHTHKVNARLAMDPANLHNTPAKLIFSPQRHETEFALTTHDRNTVLIKKFALGSDGIFTEKSTDVLYCGRRPLDSAGIAVDPFRGFVIRGGDRRWHLRVCRIKQTPPRRAAHINAHTNRAVNLHIELGRLIRRPSVVPNGDGTRDPVSFAVGIGLLQLDKMVITRDRLFLFCCSGGLSLPSACCVFDFGFLSQRDLENKEGELALTLMDRTI